MPVSDIQVLPSTRTAATYPCVNRVLELPVGGTGSFCQQLPVGLKIASDHYTADLDLTPGMVCIVHINKTGVSNCETNGQSATHDVYLDFKATPKS